MLVSNCTSLYQERMRWHIDSLWAAAGGSAEAWLFLWVVLLCVLRVSCPGCSVLTHTRLQGLCYLQVTASALSTGSETPAVMQTAVMLPAVVPSPGVMRCTMHMPYQQCSQKADARPSTALCAAATEGSTAHARQKPCRKNTVMGCEPHCTRLAAIKPRLKDPTAKNTFALLNSGMHASCQPDAAVQHPVLAVPSSLAESVSTKEAHPAIAVCLTHPPASVSHESRQKPL